MYFLDKVTTFKTWKKSKKIFKQTFQAWKEVFIFEKVCQAWEKILNKIFKLRNSFKYTKKDVKSKVKFQTNFSSLKRAFYDEKVRLIKYFKHKFQAEKDFIIYEKV